MATAMTHPPNPTLMIDGSTSIPPLLAMAATAALAACVLMSGCEGQLSLAEEGAEGEPPITYGGTADLTIASDLLMFIADHEHWSSFPGHEGLEPAASPHGAFHRTFLNSIASSNMESFESGSILVSRNYADREEPSFLALTAMQRIAGYNPDGGDWFWAKFDGAGALERDDKGIPLAGRIKGRIREGSDTGCLACHAAAPGGSFVFSM